MTTSPILNPDAAQPSSIPPLPQPGTGVRLTVNALGHSVGSPPLGQTFNHPFRPSLGSFSLNFRLGTVQSLAGAAILEPKISVNGQLVPMSGTNGIAPPALALNADVANSDGESYAALEVHPDDATGELLKDSKVEIIHTNSPLSHARTIGRCPLALILWSQRSPIFVYPLVHFNLRYFRILASAGDPTSAPKHLFL